MKVPENAQRLDADYTVSCIKRQILFIFIWNFVLSLIALEVFTPLPLFVSTAVALSISLPVLNSLVRGYHRWRANPSKLFADESGVYLEDEKMGVDFHSWDQLSGVKTVLMTGTNRIGLSSVFPLVVAFWPPSLTLMFSDGKNVDMCNLFIGKQEYLFGNLDTILSRLIDASQCNENVIKVLLNLYPYMEGLVAEKLARAERSG